MSIEKLEYVRIGGSMSKLDDTLRKCCDSGCFHIVGAEAKGGYLRLREENPYKEPLSRCIALSSKLSVKLEKIDFSSLELDNLKDIGDYFDKAERDSDRLYSELNENKDLMSKYTQALTQINHLKSLDVGLEKIFSCKHISIRVGKLPCDSLPKLLRFSEKPFVFAYYDKDEKYYWGAYWTPSVVKEEIDPIFESLFFERIFVPDYLKGTPEAESIELADDITACSEKILVLESRIATMKERESDNLKMLFAWLKTMHDSFDLRRNAVVKNETFKCCGFVPLDNHDSFLALFEDDPKLKIEMLPPDADRRLQPPVKLKNGAFSRPFSMFVEMYGLPKYDGFNPTAFVAVIYTLLFGIMFGDLGQGLVIALVGFFINKVSKNSFAQILMRIGISSAVFGAFYGSVFGYEELLNPVYKSLGFESKPFEATENTMMVLIGAIGIGVVIILVSMLLNVFIGLRNKNFVESVFGNNGLVGIVFYSALLYAIIMTLGFGKSVFTKTYVCLLIILPLLLMFFREPLGELLSGRKPEKVPIGDFIASNFFEVFEFFLGYATNTLSFVRVGGFVLSHAGMMSVVMLLSDMVSKGGSVVVVIFGNILVMGIEGLIVGIQALRLQFYEFFSRFYDGGGEAFKPVTIEFSTEIE